MPKLRKGLALDLPDPLARYAELLADLLERPGVAVDESESELDDLLLALGQRMEHALELLLQQDEAGGVDGDDGVRVLDEVAELRVLFLADRRVEGDGLLRDLLD